MLWCCSYYLPIFTGILALYTDYNIYPKAEPRVQNDAQMHGIVHRGISLLKTSLRSEIWGACVSSLLPLNSFGIIKKCIINQDKMSLTLPVFVALLNVIPSACGSEHCAIFTPRDEISSALNDVLIHPWPFSICHCDTRENLEMLRSFVAPKVAVHHYWKYSKVRSRVLCEWMHVQLSLEMILKMVEPVMNWWESFSTRK